MQASSSKWPAHALRTARALVRHRSGGPSKKGKAKAPTPAERTQTLVQAALRRSADGPGDRHTRNRKLAAAIDEFKHIGDVLAAPPWTQHVPEEFGALGPDTGFAADDVQRALGVRVDPGCLIEYFSQEPVLSIVLQYVELDEGHDRAALVIDQFGSLLVMKPNNISYTYPDFIDPDMAARIGTEYAPKDRNELMARVAAVRRMRDFSKAREDVSHGLAARFGALYDRVAARDPAEWAEISVVDALRAMGLDAHNRLLRFAAQGLLMERDNEFVPHQTAWLTAKTFFVRPRAMVERLARLRARLDADAQFWPRFGARAREVIAQLKARTAGHEDEAPSVAPADDITWSEDERLVIGVLLDSLNVQRYRVSSEYSRMLYDATKAVGFSGASASGFGDISYDEQRDLLVALGVIPPWQDTVSRRWDVVTRASGGGPPGARDAIAAAIPRPAPRSKLSPDEFYAADPCASVRHDFGDMPVYVIDDYHAQELDDGISVQRDADRPDHIWVHTHIADPTRLIHPDHAYARSASRVESSLYFHNRTQPLLPASFVAEHAVSLGSGRGAPESTLTFSALLAPDGSIAAHDVRAGTIHNVHVLHYDDVDAAMGWDTAHELVNHPFGRAPSERDARVVPELSDTARADLALLQEAQERLYAARLRSPSFDVVVPFLELGVRPSPLPAAPEHAAHPSVFRGFPSVSWASGAMINSGARDVVASAAKLAASVASLFATARDIPLVRRGLQPPRGDLSGLLELRNARGAIPWEQVFARGLIFRPATATLAPAAHFTLGVPEGTGYARVTSPLRRYEDMLAHWQLKHALLRPGGPPLFAAHELQTTIAHPAALLTAKNAARLHTREWAALAVRRYMERHPALVGGDGEGPLQSVDVVVTGPRVNENNTSARYRTLAPRLGIEIALLVPVNEDHPELRVMGSVHRVDITGVDIATRGRVRARLRSARTS